MDAILVTPEFAVILTYFPNAQMWLRDSGAGLCHHGNCDAVLLGAVLEAGRPGRLRKAWKAGEGPDLTSTIPALEPFSKTETQKEEHAGFTVRPPGRGRTI